MKAIEARELALKFHDPAKELDAILTRIKVSAEGGSFEYTQIINKDKYMPSTIQYIENSLVQLGYQISRCDSSHDYVFKIRW